MIRTRNIVSSKIVLVALLALAGCAEDKTQTADASESAGLCDAHTANADQLPQFIGRAIGLAEEYEDAYRELHADVWPEVRDAIRDANIRNYHIFVGTIDGKRYLFSFFEYHGTDFSRDFARMRENETLVNEWGPLTGSYQKIIPGTAEGAKWMALDPVMCLP